jgi:hypothetical protein
MIPDFRGPRPPIPDFSRSSFPYLRVAQFYEVPYADVLQCAERLDQRWAPTLKIMMTRHDQKYTVSVVGAPEWEKATLRAWQAERQRRMLT